MKPFPAPSINHLRLRAQAEADVEQKYCCLAETEHWDKYKTTVRSCHVLQALHRTRGESTIQHHESWAAFRLQQVLYDLKGASSQVHLPLATTLAGLGLPLFRLRRVSLVSCVCTIPGGRLAVGCRRARMRDGTSQSRYLATASCR